MLLVIASRRSGLKSVSPELFTTKSIRTFANRSRRAASKPKARLAHISFHHLDLFVEKIGEARAMALFQRIENGRLATIFSNRLLRRAGALAPNQQINFADLRHVGQNVLEPNLGDESGHSDQQHVLAAQRMAAPKSWPAVPPIREHQWPPVLRDGPRGSGRSPCASCSGCFSSPRSRSNCSPLTRPFGLLAKRKRQWTARANHRIEQPAGGNCHREIPTGWPPAFQRPDAAPTAA